MKNQNDLIFSIVSVVLALIAVGVAFGTKPEVPPAPSVPTIVVTDAALPTGTEPQMGLALPSGSGSTAAGGGMGGSMGGPGMMGGRGPGMMGGGPPGAYGGAGGSMGGSKPLASSSK